MALYSKNIAVIKGLANGFSQNGGALSGLVRTENFCGRLKVSVTKINFAPLDCGRYIVAVTDGTNSEVFEAEGGEAESAMDTAGGFAAVICFANGDVQPVAMAVCGDMAWAIPLAVRAAENAEKPAQSYEDEALAENNYYEYGDDSEGKGDVFADKTQEKGEIRADEEGGGAGAGAPFYRSLSAEIEGLFARYPHASELENMIAQSRWIKIDCKNRYYVFGVIEEGGAPACLCYGVPSKTCPQSMRKIAFYIPAGEGYWVMYQSARDGSTIRP